MNADGVMVPVSPPPPYNTDTNYESGCESDDEYFEEATVQSSIFKSPIPLPTRSKDKKIIKYRGLNIDGDDDEPLPLTPKPVIPTVSTLKVTQNSPTFVPSPEPSESDTRTLSPDQTTPSFLLSVLFSDGPTPEPRYVDKHPTSSKNPKPVPSMWHKFLYGDGTRSSDESEDNQAKALTDETFLNNQNSSLTIKTTSAEDSPSSSSSITLTEVDSIATVEFVTPPSTPANSAQTQTTTTATHQKFFVPSEPSFTSSTESDNLPEILTIPSTNHQRIFNCNDPPRPPIAKTLLNVFRAEAITTATPFLHLTNVDFVDGDESTIYGVYPSIETKCPAASYQPFPNFTDSQQSMYIPTGSVVDRRQTQYNKLVIKAYIDTLKDDDILHELYEDAFPTPEPVSRFSAKSLLASWAVKTTIYSAKTAVNAVNTASETAIAATGYLSGNSKLLVEARDGIFSRAKGFAGWAFSAASSSSSTVSSVISTARSIVPRTIDHAFAKTLGIDDAASLEGPSYKWKRFQKRTGGIGFVGAKLIDFRHFFVVSHQQEEQTGSGDGSVVGSQPTVSFRNAPSFSFSSVAGPLDALYSVGVAEGLLQQFREELFTSADGFKWLGSGYGAIVAAVMALGLGKEGLVAARAMFERIHVESTSCLLGPLGIMSELLKTELEALIPEGIQKANRDNLFISVTLIPSIKNDILSSYLTREELIQSLLASCYVPILHDTPILITNTTTRDPSYAATGAITNRLPLYDALTVTVSPIPAEANISPWCPTSSVLNYNTGYAVFRDGPVDDQRVLVGFFGSSLELLCDNGEAEKEGKKENVGRKSKVLDEIAKERLKGRRDAGLWVDGIFQSGSMTLPAFKAMV
ncbi:UNVERIFIED_CONTAM: Patatin-like phospholipase domain-containing protein 1 [Siphonaria sp. JEL0065]|nr:Patatin-like phospholipase domain-containing protein 1 [Siphonaria sp. JEL0065]